ncbi:MAG: hypothetical protein ACMXYF_05195 [Candidatus Woesearchaeota archaeon]
MMSFLLSFFSKKKEYLDWQTYQEQMNTRNLFFFQQSIRQAELKKTLIRS